MKKFIALAALLLPVLYLQAQTPFHRSYEAVGDDRAYTVGNGPNFTFLVGGRTNSYGPGARAAFISNIDTLGNVLWSKAYGGAGSDYAEKILPGGNHHYIVCRGSSFASTSNGVFLMKIDNAGDTVWTKSIEMPGSCNAYSAHNSTVDGSMYICGSVYNIANTSSDVMVMKVDTNGNVLWSKQYGGTADEWAVSICPTLGATGSLVAGMMQPANNSDRRFLLMKLNTNGDTVWTKTIADGGFMDLGEAEEMTISANVYGYLVAGTTTTNVTSGFQAGLAMLIDNNGDTVWTKGFSAGSSSLELNATHCYGSNLMLLGGKTGLLAEGAVSINVNVNGDTTWTTAMDGEQIHDAGFFFAPNHVLVGQHYESSATGNDILVARMWGDGSTDCLTHPTGLTSFAPALALGGGLAYSNVSTTTSGTNLTITNAPFTVDNQCASPSSGGVPDCTAFISEYVEGSGNNKALELYNPTANPIDLSSYSLNLYANGSPTPTSSLALSGTLQPDSVYCVVHGSAGVSGLLNNVDLSNSTVTAFNGNDAITLNYQGTVVDAIGEVGTNPGTAWNIATGSTLDHTLVRKSNVSTGTSDWSVGIGQWNVMPQNTDTAFGAHAGADCAPVVCSLSVSLYVAGLITCVGDSGALGTSVTGAYGPVSYQWSNGDTNAIATNLIADYYSVVATDSAGCTASVGGNITDPTPITAVTVGSVATNGSNGTASVSASGGWGSFGYTYLWSTSATDSAITGLAPGTYTVTVSNIYGCTAIDSAIVTDSTVTCGTLFFSEYLEGSGQNKALEIYNPNSFAVDLSDYTVKLYPNGATTTGQITTLSGILQPDSVYVLRHGSATLSGILNASDLVASSVCTFNGNDAVTLEQNGTVVDAIGEVGANPGTEWIVGTGSTLNYTLVRDASINTGTTNWTVGATQWQAFAQDTDGFMGSHTGTSCATPACNISVNAVVLSAAACFGDTITLATVVSGANGSVSYAWSTGDTTANATTIASGTFTVTVTDAIGCTASGGVMANQPAPMLATINTVHPTCVDGYMSAVPNGGSAPYSYVWSDGQTDSTAIGLDGSTLAYSVTVSDANQCTAVAYDTLNPHTLSTSIDTSANLTCIGANDGYAEVTPTSGFPPYTYFWSNGQTTQAISNLGPMNYAVTVTDAVGCTSVSGVAITTPGLLVPSTFGKPEYCLGLDGEVHASASGGTMPYSWLWSNGSTDSSQTGLAAGTYTITVTDANGCTAATTQDVVDQDNLVVQLNDFDNASCFGASDGSAEMVVTGGVPPFNYVWSSGGNSAMETQLSAGVYTVTVSDSLNCTGTGTVTIQQPTEILISFSSTLPTCGNSDGSIQSTATGGAGSYDYEWSIGDGNSVVVDLDAGTYTITVTDGIGCTSVASTSLSNSSGPVISLSSQQNVTCPGASDGAATISATGTAMPFVYAWSTGDTTEATAGLTGGTYTVSVTDTTGCIATLDVQIAEPLPIGMAVSVTTPDCGQANGSLNLLVTGGTEPYTYLWDNGSTSQGIIGLGAGSYAVTVTDSSGCTETGTFGLSALGAPTVSVNTGAVSCHGGDDGLAALVISGGAPPLTYTWSNGGDQIIEDDFEAGFHQVTVTDANSCEAVQTFEIVEPEPFSYSIDIVPAVHPGCDGEAAVNVSGGTAPYDYSWSDPANTQLPFAEDLCPGAYSVTVTDANDCEIVVDLDVPSLGNVGELVRVRNGLNVYPNPANGMVWLDLPGHTNGQSVLRIYNALGQEVAMQRVQGENPAVQVNGLRSGIYLLALKRDGVIFTARLVLD